MPATVKTLEYDPNRSAFIALVEYTDGVKSYIIAPDGLKVGDVIVSSKSADIKPGNCLPFENIPVGTIIHNIELYPGRGAQLVRSAGNMAQLMAKENGYALVRLPSGARLSLSFKERNRVSPNEYLTILRVERSKQLLTETELSIKEIAVNVGYYDASSFIRRFKQITGVTPLQYRRSKEDTNHGNDA